MLSLLISVLLSTGLQEGDHWATERTMRFVQESTHVDIKNVDKLTYRVSRVEAELFSIAEETIPGALSKNKPLRSTVTFRTSGTPFGAEDTSDPNLARINRMEWTALEPRKGISWSRNWQARPGVVEGKVIVKPTAKSLNDTTLLVTYKEGDKTKGVATIKIFNDAPIIEDLALTLNDVDIPGAVNTGSLIVSEKLKEIHLATGK